MSNDWDQTIHLKLQCGHQDRNLISIHFLRDSFWSIFVTKLKLSLAFQSALTSAGSEGSQLAPGDRQTVALKIKKCQKCLCVSYFFMLLGIFNQICDVHLGNHPTLGHPRLKCDVFGSIMVESYPRLKRCWSHLSISEDFTITPNHQLGNIAGPHQLVVFQILQPGFHGKSCRIATQPLQLSSLSEASSASSCHRKVDLAATVGLVCRYVGTQAGR